MVERFKIPIMWFGPILAGASAWGGSVAFTKLQISESATQTAQLQRKVDELSAEQRRAELRQQRVEDALETTKEILLEVRADVKEMRGRDRERERRGK